MREFPFINRGKRGGRTTLKKKGCSPLRTKKKGKKGREAQDFLLDYFGDGRERKAV